MGIDLALLEILACPSCRSKLVEAADRVVCTNSECGLRFPVRDGIPVMLIEEAERANPEGPRAS